MTDQEFLKALCTPASKSEPEIESRVQKVDTVVNSSRIEKFNLFRSFFEEPKIDNSPKQKDAHVFTHIPDYVYIQNAGIGKRKSFDISKEELPFPVLRAFIETEEIK